MAAPDKTPAPVQEPFDEQNVEATQPPQITAEVSEPETSAETPAPQEPVVAESPAPPAEEPEEPAGESVEAPAAPQENPAETEEPAPPAEEPTAEEEKPSIEAKEPAEEGAEISEKPNPYTGKDPSEILELFTSILQSKPVQSLREEVESIKVAFYKAVRADFESQLARFVAEGGNAEEFVPAENPLEARFKDLLGLYRDKRDEFLKNLDLEKQRAYEAKVRIINELKELIDSNETVGNTFQAFRELQQRWKDAGVVAQEHVRDLWETYHHHVENFYNYVKINKELRDLDLKKNYEAKILLAEEAEALSLDPSVLDAFQKLQQLHERWREIGPVATEYKEALWERFKTASSAINKRHQSYYEALKAEQEQNLVLKTELCVKCEEVADGVYTSRKEWEDASNQVVEMQKVWKTIGFGPRKENTKIYNRFRAACDRFFSAKHAYYKELRSENADNLQAKIDLCVQAEALKESDDWKGTTEALIELQKKWKEIGLTSRKQSEAVWKRFRSAADEFFKRKAEHFGEQEEKLAENLEAKKQMLSDLAGLAKEKVEVSFDKIKAYQRQWAEIGFVPIKQKEAIQTEYKKVMDQLFGQLRGEEREHHMRNFQEKVSQIRAGGVRKVNQERERLYQKLKQLEADIQVWENNIGFFSKSKNAEALVNEVQNKINKAKEQIATLIDKIKLIDHPELAKPKAEPAPEQPTVAEDLAATADDEPVGVENPEITAPGDLTLDQEETQYTASAETAGPDEETTSNNETEEA